jgi:hypothetical protein
MTHMRATIIWEPKTRLQWTPFKPQGFNDLTHQCFHVKGYHSNTTVAELQDHKTRPISKINEIPNKPAYPNHQYSVPMQIKAIPEF